jgi:uncharacterized membrane protein YidH (DUF202 family)
MISCSLYAGIFFLIGRSLPGRKHLFRLGNGCHESLAGRSGNEAHHPGEKRMPVSNEAVNKKMRATQHEHPKTETPTGADAIIINEAQLILAEKRTSLAALRTGIAVFALPLSVLSLLIATSKYYDIAQVVQLFAALLALCAGLVVLGVYLITKSILQIRRYDRLLRRLKARHSRLAEFIA